jgi:hypothetical protein
VAPFRAGRQACAPCHLADRACTVRCSWRAGLRQGIRSASVRTGVKDIGTRAVPLRFLTKAIRLSYFPKWLRQDPSHERRQRHEVRPPTASKLIPPSRRAQAMASSRCFPPAVVARTNRPPTRGAPSAARILAAGKAPPPAAALLPPPHRICPRPGARTPASRRASSALWAFSSSLRQWCSRAVVCGGRPVTSPWAGWREVA